MGPRGVQELPVTSVVTLYRPVGPGERELIKNSGWKAFPLRLPEQPFFDPVVQKNFAVRIARDSNLPAIGAGFVTRFDVEAEYLKQFPEQAAGGQEHSEHRIPGERLRRPAVTLRSSDPAVVQALLSTPRTGAACYVVPMTAGYTKSSSTEALRPLAVPVGPRLERVLAVAYRARRAVLLEGPTGVGKSEIIRRVASDLGIATIVLDLSLLEPPDLVGLPFVREGRTEYALPHVLPRDGAGILLLEELNRAERYIQQPALQLLSARRLHEYELPEGWVCVATINPQTAEYHVTQLDKALRARFLQVNVRADRASWLAWAQTQNLHPGIVALAHAHERILEDVPPRTWTYASDLLKAFSTAELADGALLRDAIGGYLPAAWVEALLASKASWGRTLELDVRDLLANYQAGSTLAKQITAYREKGQTDRLDEIAVRLASLLSGPEAGVLAAQGQLKLASFEALLADLPGDQREKLQEALGSNPTASVLIDIDPTELLGGFAGGAAEKKIASWRGDPNKHHRIALAVTGLRAFIEQPSRLAELKKSNVARTCLGQLLVALSQRDAMPLVETLKRVGITPVRPVG